MRSNAQGSVLILALWALSFLSVFAVTLGFGVRQKMTLLNRLDSLESLTSVALSGVEKAKGLIKEDVTTDFDSFTDRWAKNESELKDVVVGPGTFSVGQKTGGVFWPGVIDEGRKISLNSLDPNLPKTLSLLLQNVAELDADDADDIAFSIADWKDSDSNYGHPDKGAEDNEYEDLPMPYQCKDKAFESLDELLIVKGMNREIFDKIRPYVTVYGDGVVNINTAPREVLMALDNTMSEAMVDKILAHRRGEDSEDGTADDRSFTQAANIAQDMKSDSPPLSNQEEALLAGLVGTKLGVASNFFLVLSQATLAQGGLTRQVEAVIDREGKVYSMRS